MMHVFPNGSRESVVWRSAFRRYEAASNSALNDLAGMEWSRGFSQYYFGGS